MKEVTAELVQAVSQSVLSQGYENPVPIPEFHRDLWALCCDPHPYVAIAAPRGHAKSTAITHAYVITTLVMRERKYVLIVSDTEEQSAEFIADIKREFTDNDLLRDMFNVHKLVRDQTTDVIIQFKDGYQCRIIGKGSEQKIRGRKWRGTRPDLIVCHEKGTQIFADGEWMENTAHPTAKVVEADGYEVEVDGHIERVSSDHRYWVKRTEDSDPEWVFTWELEEGMAIGDECPGRESLRELIGYRASEVRKAWPVVALRLRLWSAYTSAKFRFNRWKQEVLRLLKKGEAS